MTRGARRDPGVRLRRVPGGRAEQPLGRRLFSQRHADDAGRRAGPFLRRSDQGQDRRDQSDLHDLQVCLSARDRAARAGAEAARRSHGPRRLLLFDHDRSRARHAGGAEGICGEVPRRARAGLFLTGKQTDIDLISKKLGLYSTPDPSNPDGHTPMLLVGNEATGQWMRNSGVDNAEVPRAHDRRLAEQLAEAKKPSRSRTPRCRR